MRAGQRGEVKIEYSHRPLPLDRDLAREILRWKDEGAYPTKDRRTSSYPTLNTGQPMWQESVLQDHIKPAAERAKLGSIGWHTFRHSHQAWLKRAQAPI